MKYNDALSVTHMPTTNNKPKCIKIDLEVSSGHETQDTKERTLIEKIVQTSSLPHYSPLRTKFVLELHNNTHLIKNIIKFTEMVSLMRKTLLSA